ncbi:MAG: hypothetical protein ABJF11_20275 [Reichenbachiella sp.]|uniref:hypothetical protein n=1 Tax=Reichenbachiella sp. TaxID=2184521 RepID=UPI0032633F31
MRKKIIKIYDIPEEEWTWIDRGNHLFNRLKHNKKYQISVITVTAATTVAFLLKLSGITALLFGLWLTMASISLMPWSWRGMSRFIFLFAILIPSLIFVYYGFFLLIHGIM